MVAEQITKDNAANRLISGSDANGGIGDWHISNGVVEAIIDNAALASDVSLPIQNGVAVLANEATSPCTPSDGCAQSVTLIDVSGTPRLVRSLPLPAPDVGTPWDPSRMYSSWSTYDFTTGSDDGRRMYIDGVLVLNDWNTQLYPGSIKVTPAALSAGLHTIVLEYFDGTGDAAASLDWALTAPATCPTKVKDWTGEYYSGIGLTGTRLLCQDDVLVNFNWGLGSPDPRLPVDGFSVRWTNNATFAATGSYVFQMGSDDGARLYVDGALVIDVWTNRTYAVSTATVVLSKGKHVIVMEYYENAGPARATLTW